MSASRRLPPWILAALLSSAGCDLSPAPAVIEGIPPDCLSRSTPLEGRAGGRLEAGRACFHLDLSTNEAVRLELSQVEADLVIVLGEPGGGIYRVVDTPVGQEAPERPCLVAPVPGRYPLLLKSFGAPDAEFSLRVLLRRRATPEDLACEEATQRFLDAGPGDPQKRTPAERAQELEAAAGLWQTAGEPLSRSMAHREAARAWETLGEYRRAENQLRRALEAAVGAESSYLELSSLNRLGLMLLNRADIHGAADAFDQALQGARAVDNRRAEASALNNLALVDESQGDLSRAVDRLRQAAQMQRELPFPEDLARTLENLAANLALLDYHQEALEHLEEALALAQAVGSIETQAHCNLEIGWVHRLRGKPREAVLAIEQALRLWRSVGDLPGQATALDRLGTTLAESGDHGSAQRAFQDSLKISRAIRSPLLEAPTLANLGCLHQTQGRAEPARRALRRVRRDFWPLLDSKARAHIHACLAELHHKTGELSPALEHIESALQLVEEIKSAARHRGARHRPIWLWQDYAELRVALLVALSEESGASEFLARAFSAADHTRSRSLFEMVLESQISSGGRRSEQEVALRRRLETLGESRRRLLAARGPRAALEPLEADLAETVLELAALDAHRREREIGPSLTTPTPVSVGEVQALLSSDEALLRYFLAPEASFLFVVRTDALTVHRLPGRKQVERHAEALHEALRSPGSAEQARLIGTSLSPMLLPPGAFPEGIQTLVVVADGSLHYVPFAMLSAPGTPAPPSVEAGPLLDQVSLRYLPSAAVGAALAHRAANRAPADKRVAVFADPVFSEDDPRLGSGTVDEAESRSPWAQMFRKPIPRLPATAEEAASILALVSPRQRFEALGFDASKRTFLDPTLAEFQILHLATHAFVDERFPQFSGLVLSRHRPDGEVIPGNLYLHEIFDLHLNADLAVLSGCQTALGRKVRGDGLLSLTRGFFHAGCSQVQVTLWSVDDRATAALMAEFYRVLLVDGRNTADALRAAQQWLRRQDSWREPYYWAPFVLQGFEPPR